MNPNLKLRYIGKQEFPDAEPLILLDVLCNGHPYHQSTRSLFGLLEIGIVDQAQAVELANLIETDQIRVGQEVHTNGKF